MNTINIKRTVSAMRWLILNRQHELLRHASVIFLLFLFVAIISTSSFTQGLSFDAVSSGAKDAAAFCFTISLIYVFLSAGRIVSDMKDTQPRINTMMLPASNKEKYLTRWIYVTVLQTVMCLAATVAADLLQMLFHFITGNTPVSMFTNLPYPSLLFPQSLLDAFYMLMVLLLAAWVHSIYLLGGTFFRRNQWILTTAVCIAVSMVVAGAVSYIIFQLLQNAADADEYIMTIVPEGYVVDSYGVTLAAEAVLLTFTVLNYWLSYRLFCRMQVINNKWINL